MIRLKKIIFLFVVVAFFTMGFNVYAATIGEKFSSPEAGWQRIDDTNSNITYTSWTEGAVDGSYPNSMLHFTNLPGSQIKFNFTGTKIRILGATMTGNATNNISIAIDSDIQEVYSFLGSVVQGGVLLYEKTGLSNTEHSVVITTNDSLYAYFDAIDIDSSAQIKTYNNIVTLQSPIIAATIGNAKVDISWGATTGTAISYNVKRATTSGGIYSTIATTSAITYTDYEVVNGTTYYYVVSAFNSSGESANSNEVSVTPTAPIEPPAISGNKAILELVMVNGTEKEYDLTATELQSFLTWFDSRSEGTGKAYYTFIKKSNVKPFISRKEYIAFDKMLSFEVKDYNE